MKDNQMQDILNAASAALREMERWRGIAQMLTHLDTGCSVVDCKHCREARVAYMDADIEYEKLMDEACEAIYLHQRSTDN